MLKNSRNHESINRPEAWSTKTMKKKMNTDDYNKYLNRCFHKTELVKQKGKNIMKDSNKPRKKKKKMSKLRSKRKHYTVTKEDNIRVIDNREDNQNQNLNISRDQLGVELDEEQNTLDKELKISTTTIRHDSLIEIDGEINNDLEREESTTKYDYTKGKLNNIDCTKGKSNNEDRIKGKSNNLDIGTFIERKYLFLNIEKQIKMF